MDRESFVFLCQQAMTGHQHKEIVPSLCLWHRKRTGTLSTILATFLSFSCFYGWPELWTVAVPGLAPKNGRSPLERSPSLGAISCGSMPVLHSARPLPAEPALWTHGHGLYGLLRAARAACPWDASVTLVSCPWPEPRATLRHSGQRQGQPA